MGRITQEQYPAMLEAFQCTLLIGVDALPDDFVWTLADGGNDAPVDRVRLPGRRQVLSGGSW